MHCMNGFVSAFSRDVVISGFHQGLLAKNTKRETYNIPLDKNERHNSNKALVQKAIKLSKNKWHIPWGMSFN